MSKALSQKGSEMEVIAKFVQLFYRFFDCLNVGNFTDGKRSHNPFKQSYRAASDFRFKVQTCIHTHTHTYTHTFRYLLFPGRHKRVLVASLIPSLLKIKSQE